MEVLTTSVGGKPIRVAINWRSVLYAEDQGEKTRIWFSAPHLQAATRAGEPYCLVVDAPFAVVAGLMAR